MSDFEELEGDALSHHDPSDSDENSDISFSDNSPEVLADIGKEQKVIPATVNPHEISKLELQKLVQAGSGRLTFMPNSNRAAKSLVWSDFEIVFVDGKQVNYAK